MPSGSSASSDAINLIIDCDAGIDDTAAILLACTEQLRRSTSNDEPKINILGITCVGGNTDLNNVVENVVRVLKFIRKTDIPVFRGANTGIVEPLVRGASKIHGHDGFGGVANTMPLTEQDMDAVVGKENAVIWLGSTVRDTPINTITLISLGPMTNLAFVHRLYPDFSQRLKRLVVMGGTLDAKGNHGLTSEFNVAHDPEAAKLVLEDYQCPITLITFDLCRQNGFEMELYEELVERSNSVVANLIHKLFLVKHEYMKTASFVRVMRFFACDWIAMACALSGDRLIQKSKRHHVTIELAGQLTRGQSVIDWRDVITAADPKKNKLDIVTKIDMQYLQTMFKRMLL